MKANEKSNFFCKYVPVVWKVEVFLVQLQDRLGKFPEFIAAKGAALESTIWGLCQYFIIKVLQSKVCGGGLGCMLSVLYICYSLCVICICVSVCSIFCSNLPRTPHSKCLFFLQNHQILNTNSKNSGFLMQHWQV